MEKIFLLVLLLTVITSVYGMSNECLTKKYIAENYALIGETLSDTGEVHIDSKNYCVFGYSTSRNDISHIIILSDNSRSIDNNKIILTSFSIYTKDFVDQEQSKLQKAFDDSYDNFRVAKETYETNFDSIKTLIDMISNSVDICMDIIFPIKICASDEIKGLAVKKFYGLGGPDWDGTVRNFQDLRGNTLEIASDNVIYFDEINNFYKGSLAIQKFLYAVDNKTGLTLSKNLPYDFSEVFKSNLNKAKLEPNLIAARVKARQDESKDKLIALDDNIDVTKNKIKTSLTNGLLLDDQKSKFCQVLLNKPVSSLLNDEQFNEFDSHITKSSSMLNEIESSLSTTKQQDPGPLHIFKIKWYFGSLFWSIAPC